MSGILAALVGMMKIGRTPLSQCHFERITDQRFSQPFAHGPTDNTP
jgi:hypothetical protein